MFSYFANAIVAVEDDEERCNHLRKTFNMLPPKHRDCLEFLVFHLARVAIRESENLVSSIYDLPIIVTNGYR